MAVRKRRIVPDFRRAALADLALPDITTDQQTDSYAWTDTLNLADRFQLTVYDAAYFELAQRVSPATRYARPGPTRCRHGNRRGSARDRTQMTPPTS
jgi:hypothetical protein